MATLPPLLSAVATAGRHGVLIKSVLIKSVLVMERLGQVDAVALDKTGTLTEGTPRVTDIQPLAASGLTQDSLLALAAAAEHPSEHPLARSIVAAARTRELDIPPVETFTSTAGTGVTATVNGHPVAVGSSVRLLGSRSRHPAAAVAARLEEKGRTAVLVIQDDTPVGVLGIADRLRDKAAATVTALATATGTAPVLVTGDNPRAAAHLAAEVGIADVRAGLLPQDKVTAVQNLQQAGRKVLMVGDGVNDAPALAAAYASIAMGRAGSDLALDTADAVVVRDELATIPAVVALAQRARRLVVQNLVIAALFITGLVIWDLIGTLPLPLGVAGHEGSTVIVGLNGLRLLTDAAWRRAERPEHSAEIARPDHHHRNAQE